MLSRNPELKRIANRSRPLSKNKMCTTKWLTGPIKLEITTVKQNNNNDKNEPHKEKSSEIFCFDVYYHWLHYSLVIAPIACFYCSPSIFSGFLMDFRNDQ